MASSQLQSAGQVIVEIFSGLLSVFIIHGATTKEHLVHSTLPGNNRIWCYNVHYFCAVSKLNTNHTAPALDINIQPAIFMFGLVINVDNYVAQCNMVTIKKGKVELWVFVGQRTSVTFYFTSLLIYPLWRNFDCFGMSFERATIYSL